MLLPLLWRPCWNFRNKMSFVIPADQKETVMDVMKKYKDM